MRGSQLITILAAGFIPGSTIQQTVSAAEDSRGRDSKSCRPRRIPSGAFSTTLMAWLATLINDRTRHDQCTND